MLDLYLAITVATAKIVSAFQDRNEEVRRKRNAIKSGRSFYIDRHGTKHRTSNDEPYDYYYDAIRGATYEINPYTFEYRRNITAENKKRIENTSRQKALKNGEEFYAIEGPAQFHLGEIIEGTRYKRIGSNQIYVKRYLCCHNEFWLNTNTGMFDYCTTPNDTDRIGMYYIDGKTVESKWTSELERTLINKLNQRQKEYIDKYGLNDRLVWRNDAK